MSYITKALQYEVKHVVQNANCGPTLTEGHLRIAEPGAQIDDPLLQTILANYLAARRSPTPHNVGKHWNWFRDDFDRLIRTPEIWPRFRRMAVSFGFDDSLWYKESRPRPDQNPAMRSHRGPFVQASQFNDKELRNHIRLIVKNGGLSAKRIQALGEAKIGDPGAQRFADFPAPIDYHDLSQVFFASSLERALGGRPAWRILEIGGGYGALAAKLRRINAGSRLVLIDLPETLAVQHWYLVSAMPGARLIGYQEYCNLGVQSALEQADVLLLPPAAIAELPARIFDAAINIRSFAEMTTDYVRFYVSEIERTLKKNGIFYYVNRLQKKSSGDLIRIEDTPFDDNWCLDNAHPLPWQPHIIELVIRRATEANPGWRKALGRLAAQPNQQKTRWEPR
jgi:putative sugar O-methyltransferase